MANILEFIKKYKYYILISIIIIILITAGIIFYFHKSENNEIIETNDIVDNIEINNDNIVDEEIKIENITIDIKGEVNNPGVYELPVGSRVIDAIKISGGVTKKADTSNINLSKLLNDQNVIVVDNKYNKEVVKYIEKECNCSNINDSCINNDDLIDSSDKNTETSKISINTASKEELMNLSGIGESKAIEIINYRNEFGSFKNIEEIKNISGIGDKLFEKIKQQITI